MIIDAHIKTNGTISIVSHDHITPNRLYNIFVMALSGGINHWCDHIHSVERQSFDEQMFAGNHEPRMETRPICLETFKCSNWMLEFTNLKNDSIYLLASTDLPTRIKQMATHFPEEFKRLTCEESEYSMYETKADTIVQLLLFGRIIFD